VTTSKPASKDHDKAFGGKQAPAFGKGKKEQENAKGSKRERSTTSKEKKK
jgi:hypothetical protein